MGNLVDVWLLYMPNTDQNKILDYERELINRPFESPLKENHCYKKVEPEEITDITISENLNNSDNVVHLKDYVKVNNQDLEIKEYNNQRVITPIEISKIHEKPIKAVNQQIERNKHHLIENVDYFIITREQSEVTACDFKKYFNSNRQKELYLITEMGYLMLVKSFVDDLSWTVQRQLVNTYFKMKQLQQDPEVNNYTIHRQIRHFKVND
jgi:hypothetical protein